MMSRIVFSLMLARVMTPDGRGNSFGCGAPVGGSAGSCEVEAPFAAVLVFEPCALARAPPKATHKKISPAKIAARLNPLLTFAQDRFIVIAFPFKLFSSAPAF
jgi:hypothetical protein